MTQAVKRLQHDLKQLLENPLAGTSAMPLENNLMVWHCTTIVPEGSPYTNTPLHWIMEFPPEYPNKAPKAYFVSYLAYYNGATAKDDKGRTYLCLDLFGNFDHVHTEWKNNQGSGWSSSYTVSTILLQFQSALMDSNFLSETKDDLLKCSKEAWALHCAECDHRGDKPQNYRPQIPSEEDLLVSQMKMKASMSTTSLEDQFICYATQEKLSPEVIIGYGIEQKRNKGGKISSMNSPCEYLSSKAFANGTNQSTQKRPLTHWLPIYINSDHWTRAKPQFMKSINQLAVNPKDPEPVKILSVLSSLMNGVVVDVMNIRSDTNASERFLEGYYAFYRLLAEFGPDLRAYADKKIDHFLASPANRTKQQVPNLGDWLILLAVSSKKWSEVAIAFQEECDARCVFWYTTGTYTSQPSNPELSSPTNIPNRYEKVFRATQVSRNLVCFQSMFIRFVQKLDLKELDANYGIPSEQTKKQLKSAYDTITKISTWKEYFDWNQIPPVTDAKRNEQLVTAVNLSLKAGYHKLTTSKKEKINHSNNW